MEFVKVPHWNLSYILKGGLYCVPNPNVKLVKLADVINAMRLRFNIYYVFLGMKKADGMNRRLMLNRYESSNYENNGEDLEIVYKTFPMSRRILFEYDLKNGRDLERY